MKTRLSPALPSTHAASLYAALLADTLAAAAEAAAGERSLWWADAPGPAPAGWRSHPQHGVDLGERLANAFATLLGEGPVIVAGTDAPGVRAEHIDTAFALLERHEVVLGPTPDGGYWCVGLRARAPTLFRNVPWSTAAVLETTIDRARDARLSVGLGVALADLDTPADLAGLVGRLARSSTAAGANVHEALAAMGLAPDRLIAPSTPAAGAASP